MRRQRSRSKTLHKAPEWRTVPDECVRELWRRDCNCSFTMGDAENEECWRSARQQEKDNPTCVECRRKYYYVRTEVFS